MSPGFVADDSNPIYPSRVVITRLSRRDGHTYSIYLSSPGVNLSAGAEGSKNWRKALLASSSFGHTSLGGRKFAEKVSQQRA